MVALPYDNTCFDVVESYGIELPSGAIQVYIVKFALPDVDTYSKYGVMVDGCYNSNLVEMANITGSWKSIGMKKAAACNVVDRLNEIARSLPKLEDEMRTGLHIMKGKTFKMGYEARVKGVGSYNRAIGLMAKYGVSAGRKMKYDHSTKSVGFDYSRPRLSLDL
jgi:hypothetical protein